MPPELLIVLNYFLRTKNSVAEGTRFSSTTKETRALGTPAESILPDVLPVSNLAYRARRAIG